MKSQANSENGAFRSAKIFRKAKTLRYFDSGDAKIYAQN